MAGFGTGAFLSGFLQGFVLFLAIPVEWSLPFGGLPIFGAVAVGLVAAGTAPRTYRVEVALVRVDDRWLVDDVVAL